MFALLILSGPYQIVLVPLKSDRMLRIASIRRKKYVETTTGALGYAKRNTISLTDHCYLFPTKNLLPTSLL